MGWPLIRSLPRRGRHNLSGLVEELNNQLFQSVNLLLLLIDLITQLLHRIFLISKPSFQFNQLFLGAVVCHMLNLKV